jgi:hypothetical protein
MPAKAEYVSAIRHRFHITQAHCFANIGRGAGAGAKTPLSAILRPQFFQVFAIAQRLKIARRSPRTGLTKTVEPAAGGRC